MNGIPLVWVLAIILAACDPAGFFRLDWLQNMKKCLLTIGLLTVATASQAQDVSGGAVAGIGSLMSLLMLLLFLYGIFCVLVPIFIYRIMRNGTRSHETLLRIEKLLLVGKAPEIGNERLRNLAALVEKNEKDTSQEWQRAREDFTLPPS